MDVELLSFCPWLRVSPRESSSVKNSRTEEQSMGRESQDTGINRRANKSAAASDRD